ncbi:MAG: AAA family ATPase [Nitrososphaeria archaeon]|nr:AAA family ATPase [Nitrososphaeria archaeon]
MEKIYNKNDILEEIFTRAMKGPQIFKNKSVLFHDYIPRRLLFREDQISRMGYLFSYLIRNQRSSNLFIYGKPGTGKTAVTRYVVSRLDKISKKINRPLRISYVNCRLAGTEYRAASALAKDVELQVPFTGLAVREVFERFKLKVFSDRYPVLVILDEVDALVSRYGDDLLYGLTRMNDETEKANVMIIGISNDVQFKEYLDPRVLSSLSEEEVVFKPYTPEELESILWDRVSTGFRDGTISREAVTLCAAISGAEHGDARKALDLLRVAGELAENEGSEEVSIRHVNAARERIEQNRVVEVIRSLPLHSKLVLTAVIESLPSPEGRVKNSITYGKYSILARDFAGQALSSRRFFGLVKELSVLGLLDRRIENYGRRGGRVTTIALDIPMNMIRDSLIEDPVIGELFNT